MGGRKPAIFITEVRGVKVREAIEMVNKLKPNKYGDAEKMRWLSEVDGMIVREIIDTHEDSPLEGPFEGYVPGADEDTELLVPAPYDSIYRWWLESQIDMSNMEIGKYNNSSTMYNRALVSFSDYYNRTHMPVRRGGFIFTEGRRR